MPRPYAAHVPPTPHALMFHHFHDNRSHLARQGSLTTDTLENLLDHLEASVDLLPAHRWLARAEAGTLAAHDVCLTFDDSLRCQLDLAVPELERRELTAFFFVYSAALRGPIPALELYAHFRHHFFESVDHFYAAFFATVDSLPDAARCHEALANFTPSTYLTAAPFYSDNDRRFRFLRDRVLGPTPYHAAMDTLIGDRADALERSAAALWMREEDVVSLHRRGHMIGLHSWSHPTDLAAYPPPVQKAEYERNQRHLTALIGAPITTVAHPCGAYNHETLGILRDLGVTIGFRADMAVGGGTALEYPRQDHANVLALMAKS